MMTEEAQKLAKISLRIYGHEGTFEFGVLEHKDLEPLARAFEELGCTVARNPQRGRLAVTYVQGETLPSPSVQEVEA